jgi:hypothetical protein
VDNLVAKSQPIKDRRAAINTVGCEGLEPPNQTPVTAYYLTPLLFLTNTDIGGVVEDEIPAPVGT